MSKFDTVFDSLMASGEMDEDEARALATKATAEARTSPVRTKVSEKGCLQLQGGNIRRYGATFYGDEWETIIAAVSDGTLRTALDENRAEMEQRVANRDAA
ncbi:MAG: hypothetical protein ACXABY_32575 [Candidatus Thorarchaeota archaeon]|jgi:hypothetical protein